MKQRSIGLMIVLMLFSVGLYMIYWFIVTKWDLNERGGKIPTTLLFFIPLANFYYLYKFAQSFSAVVLKDNAQTIPYFLMLALIMPVGVIICQSNINDMTTKNM